MAPMRSFGGGVQVSVRGVDELQLKLWKKTKKYTRGYARGLRKAARFIMGLSKRIVPVDTGDLKRSAFIKTTGRGFTSKVDVGYTMYYAIFVHENLYYLHKKGKTAKYLQKPIEQNAEKIATIIRDEMRKG